MRTGFPHRVWLLLILCAGAVLADDPVTFDQRFAVVATDSSGYGGSIIPYQGPQFFEPLRTAWWYNYTPYQQSQYVPGLTLFWPGYQRLYMFWKAVATTSDAAIQQYARAAKAADPARTIWWAMSNEPNDRGQANQSAADFAVIYLKHHRNLRIGDPTCKIMGPGILNWTFQSDSCYQTGKSWYDDFRAAWAANPDCVAYSQSVNGTSYPPQDAFCIHSYDLRGQSPVPYAPDDWRWCRDQLTACHDDLQTYPETQGLKVWNTEFGGLKGPTAAQAADMMSGLTLWMREKPWMERWFLFYTHDDKYSGFSTLNLFDDTGAMTQLGRGYRDLSLLPMDASFYHVPYHAAWDQGAAYVRTGWASSSNIAETCGAPGYSLFLTNGLYYSANSMRGRTYTPASGHIYRVRFNYLANYDNACCAFAMDTPGQVNRWVADSYGVSTDYVDIDLSSDPVASVSFGLLIKSNFTYSYTTGDWRGVVSNLMLLTCPDPPVVTDEGPFTGSPNRLSASWTVPAGGKQPVTEYEYAIGTAPKAADTVGWTSTGAETSFSREDLALVEGVTYYVSVRARDSAGNWGAVGVSDGIRKVALLRSPHEAKRLRSNTPCALENVVVSGVFEDGVYVQNESRCSGIRVAGTLGLQAGDVITITGDAGTDGKEAVIKNPTVVSLRHGNPPMSLVLNSKAMGGSALNLQPSVINYADREPFDGRYAAGLGAIGLLVRTAGRITSVDQAGACAYLDDGAGLKDGSGNVGVRVSLDYGPIPNPGAIATVTGCCGAVDIGGNCVRLLRPRSSSDLWFSFVANYLGNPGFETGSSFPWTMQGAGAAVRANPWKSLYAHSGSGFLGVYAYGAAYSGVVTQVTDVPAGKYRATVWSRVFHTGTLENSAMNRVGLDPTGGTDPNSSGVVWSDWDSTPLSSITPWREITTPVVAVAGGPCAVLLQYSQDNPSYAHINCFDDARLVAE